MKAYSVYRNTNYKVELTGGSVVVYDSNDNLKFKINKLKYAYTGRFKPNSNIFIVRTDSSLLMLDIEKEVVTHKVKVKNVNTLNDHECTFNNDGSIFYNIESTTNVEFRIALYSGSDLSFIEYIYGPTNMSTVTSIEIDNDDIYVLVSYRNKQRVASEHYIGLLKNNEIINKVPISEVELFSIVRDRNYFLNGITQMYNFWHLVGMNKEINPLNQSLKNIYLSKC